MGVATSPLFEALVSASPDAVIVVAPDGRIAMASRAVRGLFGYEPGELVGETLEVLLPEEARGRHTAQRDIYAARPEARPMGTGLDLHGRRRDGTTFPVDVSLSPVDLGGSSMVAAFVRDATEQRRREAVLKSVNDISRDLLAYRPTAETLALAAGRARSLVGATSAWIVAPRRQGMPLVVAAADGKGAETLLGAELPDDKNLSAKAMAEGVPLPIEDMTSHPLVLAEGRRLGLCAGLYLPMLAEGAPVGTLVVGRSEGEPPFDEREVQILEVFASAASIVLSLGQAREEIEAFKLVSEQERIARDLHDTVIQRLFALGMSLQGITRLTDGVVGERIDAAVQVIDQVIREIRETIFEMHRPVTGGPDVRGQMHRVALEAAGQLGFEPRLAFRGPVEASVTDDLASQLVAVAREGLSNAARHARATSAEVVLAAADGWVTLSVVDDGVGVPAGPTAGHGLANLTARARDLGGDMTVGTREPAGTILEWRVPAPTG